MPESTIAAVITPPGIGGVAAVRLSGSRALEIAARLFRPAGNEGEWASHRAVYGILFFPPDKESTENKEDRAIDQAIALPMLAPRSYTGEDTVEFFCHGGTVVVQEVLEACVAAGAEPAPPGEFTRRAFLNGKLGLDQAEAVADLIHAESRLAARASVRQIMGSLENQLTEIEEPLLGLLARAEGALEFADDEDVTVPTAELLAILEGALERIASLLEFGRAGKLLRDGVQIVLAGPPNVGKSSLLNALAGQERAIVDAEPGTTRDVVSVRLRRAGHVYDFHDTAGLREDAGRVESRGIEHTHRMIAEADLVLHLRETGTFAAGIDDDPRPAGAAAAEIRVATKSDLAETVALPDGVVRTSSVKAAGLAELWAAIDHEIDRFRMHDAVELGVVLNGRHLHKLRGCREELESLVREIRENDPGLEVVGTLLASITAHLGEVSGRVFSEQVLEEIFRRFCVGK